MGEEEPEEKEEEKGQGKNEKGNVYIFSSRRFHA